MIASVLEMTFTLILHGTLSRKLCSRITRIYYTMKITNFSTLLTSYTSPSRNGSDLMLDIAHAGWSILPILNTSYYYKQYDSCYPRNIHVKSERFKINYLIIKHFHIRKKKLRYTITWMKDTEKIIIGTICVISVIPYIM